MKNNDTTVPTDSHAGIDFNYSESQFVIQVDFEVHAGKHRARKYIYALYTFKFRLFILTEVFQIHAMTQLAKLDWFTSKTLIQRLKMQIESTLLF